jgi:tetratricopeptide (TPR) repeat protein
LSDWVIPLVYEAAPAPVFLRTDRRRQYRRPFPKPAENSASQVPDPLTTGFVGQDDTLLDLERAFAHPATVLLHGLAGSGKSSAAAEFARWYLTTDGVQRIVYTSFEHHLRAAQVIDACEGVFSDELRSRSVEWLILSFEEKLATARNLMDTLPTLWIWDNIEAIADLPALGQPAWTPEDRGTLRELLTQLPTRFLLTSRRAANDIGAPLNAVGIRPLEMKDRAKLARILASGLGKPIENMLAWKSLFDFSAGNPLTIRVTVGQAIRDHLETSGQIEAFVAALRSGTANITDDQAEGRSMSLGASLSYGFEHAFDERERGILALLHLFQGFIDVITLAWMGLRDYGNVLELNGFDRESRIGLLDRAADVGLLSRSSQSGYWIHPALPWYFRRLFDSYYDAPGKARATQAYARSIGALGSYYQGQFAQGNRECLQVLKLQEANLLHAHRLGIENKWLDAIIGAAQGLRTLYENSGRNAEWAPIVSATVPLFVDLTTDLSLPGPTEEQWTIASEFRVQLMRKGGQLDEAERLQRIRLQRARAEAAPDLASPFDQLDEDRRKSIERLAASIGELGTILKSRADARCQPLFQECLSLHNRLGDGAGEAITAFHLADAATEVVSPPDLDGAERWYKHSLELRSPQDSKGKSDCYSGLGFVALMRFRSAVDAGLPDETVLPLAADATTWYRRAITLVSPDDIEALATLHNQLAVVLDETGEPEKAVKEFRDSLRYEEARGDRLAVAQARYNVALALGNSRRFDEALMWVDRALHDYEGIGDRATEDVERTRKLRAEIEGLKGGGG